MNSAYFSFNYGPLLSGDAFCRRPPEASFGDGCLRLPKAFFALRCHGINYIRLGEFLAMKENFGFGSLFVEIFVSIFIGYFKRPRQTLSICELRIMFQIYHCIGICVLIF